MIAFDTSYLVALAVPADRHHEAAVRLQGQIVAGDFGDGVLPDVVVVELCSVLLGRAGHMGAQRFVAGLRGSPRIQRDTLRLDEAFAAFCADAKGKLSVADWAVVHAARRAGAEFVATFDTDFDGVKGITRVP